MNIGGFTRTALMRGKRLRGAARVPSRLRARTAHAPALARGLAGTLSSKSLPVLARLASRRLAIIVLLIAAVGVVFLYAARRFREFLQRPATQTRPAPPRQPPVPPPPSASDDGERVTGDRYAIPQARSTKSPIPWTVWQVILSLGIAAIVLVVALGVVALLTRENDDSIVSQQTLLLGATLALNGVMLLTVWYFAIRPAGGSWALLGFRRIAPISTTLIVILGIASAQAVVIAYTQVVHWLDYDALIPGDTFESLDIDAVSFIIIAMSAIVFAPLFEEMFFRGFMYQAFRKSMPLWPAVLLSSAIFGIVHLDAAIMIPIALVGMILLGIYRWTGNLWSSIITHAGYNAFGITALAVQTWGG